LLGLFLIVNDAKILYLISPGDTKFSMKQIQSRAFTTFMYNTIANLYYNLIIFRNVLYSKYFVKKIEYTEIPIVINNRNRITFLKKLIDSLKSRGYNNIFILDNNSTYEPLLEFYKSTDCKVIMLGKNLGYDALNKIDLYKKIKKNYFVYTDSDVLPNELCPNDFINTFLSILKKYPKIQKVGFALKIDDLPDFFDSKQKVINWESKFYETEIEKGLYLAPIDTTFALHRPLATISTKGRYEMIRAGFPYNAYHLPWYNNSKELSQEEIFYINSIEIGTHWTAGLLVEGNSFFERICKNFNKKATIKIL
jgi:hypothetical protein